MNPQPKNKEEILNEALNVFSKVSPEEAEAAQEETLAYLESYRGEIDQAWVWDTKSVRPTRRLRWLAVAAMTTAIFLAVFLPISMRPSAPAVLEVAARKVQFGETVSEIFGEVVRLEDGTRVEMRANSQLVLERADDGVRIRLDKGDIVVSAARQHGHLYVKTKDVMVSVVGTVFYVKAGQDGSRVAVIEGEVHVQQGATETKLGPGEQVASNPKMEAVPVQEQVAWSREAAAHVAPMPQTSPKERLAFEVASIRPSGPATPSVPGARGGGGGGANSRPTKEGCVPDSAGYSYQLDPRRLAINRVTLFQLIAQAYPGQGIPGSPFRSCQLMSSTGRLSGGLEWIKTDMWDLQASIAEGSIPATTKAIFPGSPGDIALWKIADPKVQQMLQTLLSERFNVVLRRETRELPVYLLKVGKNGPKFNGHGEGYARMRGLDADGTIKPASELPPPPDGSMLFGVRGFEAQNVSMAQWAEILFGLDGRPVLDRTNLTGRFDFHFTLDAPSALQDPFAALDALKRDGVKAVGFELEESREPFDVWVIVSAEKPSEN